MIYPRKQPIHIHRLNNDFISVDVGAIAQRRNDDYRYVRESRIPDLLRAEMPPIHHRHPQIENDQIGRRFLIQVVQSLPAIPGRHRAIALHLEKRDHRFARVFVVLDDEDFGILPFFVSVHQRIVPDSIETPTLGAADFYGKPFGLPAGRRLTIQRNDDFVIFLLLAYILLLVPCKSLICDYRSEMHSEVDYDSSKRLVETHGGRLRIVVVEDNCDAAEALKMLLELYGHSPTVIADGLAAIDAVRDGAFEIGLVDIGLPGIDGYEVARRIREIPNAKTMTLVALTGYGQETDKQRALSAGFDEHLTKPVKIERLQAVLNRPRR
jgi:CheY-like chemotaxis protein